MRYRAVLFDVDGTIVDSQRAELKAFEKVLGELGLPAPDAQLKESALRGPGLRVLEGLGVKNAKEAGLRWGRVLRAGGKTAVPGNCAGAPGIAGSGGAAGNRHFAHRLRDGNGSPGKERAADV